MSSTQLVDMLHFESKSSLNRAIRDMFKQKIDDAVIASSKDSRGYVIDYFLPELESKMFVAKNNIDYLETITKFWIDNNEQKQEMSIPKTFSESLLLAGKLQAEKEQLEAKILLDAPSVKFANIVQESSNTRCIRVWVKSMKHEHNLTVGEREVFKWLMDNKYIFRSKDDKGYLPYAKYEANNNNYFTIVIDDINGRPIRMLKITGRGVVALTDKVINYFNK